MTVFHILLYEIIKDGSNPLIHFRQLRSMLICHIPTLLLLNFSIHYVTMLVST